MFFNPARGVEWRRFARSPAFLMTIPARNKKECVVTWMIWLENQNILLSHFSAIDWKAHSTSNIVWSEQCILHQSVQLWRKSSPTQINLGLHVCQSAQLHCSWLPTTHTLFSNCELLHFSLKLHAVNQIPAKMLSITCKWMKLCHECFIKTTYLQEVKKIRWLKA